MFDEKEDRVAIVAEYVDERNYVIDGADTVEVAVVDYVTLCYHKRDWLSKRERLPEPRDVDPEDVGRA